MTNKNLHEENEIAMRGVKSYMMAPVRAKRVPSTSHTIFMRGVLHLYSSHHKRFCITPSAVASTTRREKTTTLVCSKLSITRL